MQHGIKRVSLTAEAKKAKIERDKLKISNYRKLMADILERKEKQDYSNEALELTTNLLNLNPELYTVWNYRREILLQLITSPDVEISEKKDALEYDLKMVMAFLKRYPKCYWVWNHRIWCLQELSSRKQANWLFELGIVSKLLVLDARNFHGWQYRRFVVENMENELKSDEDTEKDGEDSSDLKLLDIKFKEYQYTTSKINSNISNFSAWHNRSKLIPQLYNLWKATHVTPEIVAKYKWEELTTVFVSPYTIITHELELLKTGMYMDVDDTSVWLYLQWLITDPFFVDDLRKEDEAQEAGKKSYLQILKGQLEVVEELNELEKDDDPDNKDNIWCVKTIIILKGLIKDESISTRQEDANKVDLEVKELFEKLIDLDPIRKGRYVEQLEKLKA